jgi:sialic acid synthase
MKIIAEIGCNHCGSMDIAKEMIQTLSIYCKVKYIKFQKRCIKELLNMKEYERPYDNPNSYGKTYGKHREYLEFNLNQHKELKEECEKYGVEYLCSVWDLTSAKEIISLNTNKVKVPSASNLDFKMLEYIRDEFKGEIHISLGMTTKEEIQKIYSFMFSRRDDLILYACTSGYPIKFEDVCLKDIESLEIYKCKGYGYSGHHLGIAIDMGAVCQGYDYLERHFTLDRIWKGTDHVASLEPDGMRRLVRDIKAMQEALSYKKDDILEVEKPTRKKLKRCL